jgi:transcriptional regulator with XRE-family HTH domain
VLYYKKDTLNKEKVSNMEKYFGSFLKQLRLDRGMSLRMVEKITKISNPYISQIERGERGIPNFSILKRLAEAYGVKVTDLIENAEKPARNEKVHSKKIAPDVNFISRGYEKLSENRKQALKEFLQHLVEQEEKKGGVS